jgi:outer membrane protein TolC
MKNSFPKYIFIVLSFFFFLFSPLLAIAAKPSINIGIVLDGPWGRLQENIEIVRQEINALTEAEFDVAFPEAMLVDGQWTVAGINRAIDSLLANKDTDLIITLGHVASNEIAKRRDLSKPAIAALLIDANLQNLPITEGSSGVTNLAYVDRMQRIDRELSSFHDITPISHLAIMVDNNIIQTIPQVVKATEKMASQKGIKLSIVGVETSATEALQKLDDDVDGVLITPLYRITNADFQNFVDGLIQQQLPSYSYIGIKEVEQGIFASFSHESSTVHLTRNVALVVHDILRGQKPENIQVSFADDKQLVINMATARAINIYPDFDVLTEADLLHEKELDIARKINLHKAVQDAISSNLDLAAADHALLAGAQKVNESRAPLLPQVGLGAGAVKIDDDRAAALNGNQPEKTFTGVITASQIIYSDKAWTGYETEKFLQDSRNENRESLRLDVVLAASSAYLNVLRAETIESIEKENLKLTRANLERAQVRVNVGAAGPEEVYRWEVEIAKRRQTVLQAESSTLDSKNELNRILNRPLQELFLTEEMELADPLQMLADDKLVKMISNSRKLNIFRSFMVGEGLEISPELKSIDSEIAAQERIRLSARRSLWLPDFSLEGDVYETFDQSGAGSSPPPGVEGKDSTDWSVGAFATIPLIAGGGKTATLNRTTEELSSLRLNREATANRIEQSILFAINLIRASYPSIQLSQDAALASDKNLELVTDSYERGILSIIDLLDAQNQALSANLDAANSVYNFLVDLMKVQRSLGMFIFFLGQDEKQIWYQNMEDFYQSAQGSN